MRKSFCMKLGLVLWFPQFKGSVETWKSLLFISSWYLTYMRNNRADEFTTTCKIYCKTEVGTLLFCFILNPLGRHNAI